LANSPPYIDIEPRTGWRLPDLRELIRFRELLYLLTWRDIRVLYKQTVIGAPWAILQPLLLMLIYSFIFGVVLRLPTNDIPFPLFVFIGLLVWTFFSVGVSRGAASVIANGHIIRKVYFPHFLLPIAAVMSCIADLIATFAVTLLLAFANGYLPTARYAALIPLFGLLFVTTLGFALWSAALNTRYRDLGLALPLILQVLFYLSPVLYTSAVFGDAWRVLMGIFPVATIVELTRWSFTGVGDPLPAATILLSCLSAALILIGGALYFQRVSAVFADLV
jgi:lipopolysaccharide transport system permease protein